MRDPHTCPLEAEEIAVRLFCGGPWKSIFCQQDSKETRLYICTRLQICTWLSLQLLEAGAEVDYCNLKKGGTALLSAINSKEEKAAEMLLQWDANPFQTNQ